MEPKLEIKYCNIYITYNIQIRYLYTVIYTVYVYVYIYKNTAYIHIIRTTQFLGADWAAEASPFIKAVSKWKKARKKNL